jgi:hypothetical protein
MDTNLPLSQLDPIGANAFTGGVGSLMEKYLGPMPQMTKSDPYAHQNRSIWDMPSAYYGQNLFIGQFIEDVQYTVYNGDLTREVMPIEITNQITVAWEKFRFNAHLMEQTPNQTTAHLVSSSRQIMRAQLVRWGIRAQWEVDFLGTQTGRMVYLKTIDQLARARQATMEAEIMRTLASGHRVQQQWVREHGQPQDQRIEKWLTIDKDTFAISQKTKNGLEKLDAHVNTQMQARGGTGDTYLLPETISIFQSLGPNEKTDLYLAGQAGPDRVNGIGGGRAALGQGNLKGLEPRRLLVNSQVIVIKNNRLEHMTAEETDYLRRVRQIGEYYTMFDECKDHSRYSTEHRSILIYNEDIDDMSKIDLRMAIENLGIWDGEGKVKPVGLKGNAANNDQIDADNDFLTYLTDTPTGGTRRATADYIADIAPEHLSVNVLRGAVASIKAAIARQVPGVGVFLSENPVGTTYNEALARYDQLSDELKSRYETVARALENMLSSSRYQNVMMLADFFNLRTPGERLFVLFANRAFVPVYAAETRQGANQNRAVNSKVDSSFVRMIHAQVPASKKDETRHLLESDEPALARGEQIKRKMADYIAEGTPGIRFKTTDSLNEWYDERVSQYHEALSSERPAPVASSDRREIAGFMPAGRDLTGTGYEYVYSASAKPARDESDMYGLFRIVRDMEESAGSAQPVQSRVTSGGGRGLQSIGQFFEDTNVVRAARNASLNGLDISSSRLRTLIVQHNQILRSGMSEVDRTLALYYLMTPLTLQNMLNFCDHDIRVPLHILLARPHQQYVTRGLIKCASGGRTGRLFSGDSNFLLGTNVNVKKVDGFLTLWMRAVVTNPENVWVQPDVHVVDYERGAGVRFWDPETYATMDLDNYENSLIAIALPPTETSIPCPMDLAGRFYTEYDQGRTSRASFERLHYSTAYRYEQMYGFRRKSQTGAEVPLLASGRNHYNRIMWPGHQQNFNPNSGNWDRIKVNKGHWGPNVYATCGEVRRGKIDTFKEQNYAMMNVFAH